MSFFSNEVTEKTTATAKWLDEVELAIKNNVPCKADKQVVNNFDDITFDDIIRTIRMAAFYLRDIFNYNEKERAYALKLSKRKLQEIENNKLTTFNSKLDLSKGFKLSLGLIIKNIKFENSPLVVDETFVCYPTFLWDKEVNEQIKEKTKNELTNKAYRDKNKIEREHYYSEFINCNKETFVLILNEYLKANGVKSGFGRATVLNCKEEDLVELEKIPNDGLFSVLCNTVPFNKNFNSNLNEAVKDRLIKGVFDYYEQNKDRIFTFIHNTLMDEHVTRYSDPILKDFSQPEIGEPIQQKGVEKMCDVKITKLYTFNTLLSNTLGYRIQVGYNVGILSPKSNDFWKIDLNEITEDTIVFLDYSLPTADGSAYFNINKISDARLIELIPVFKDFSINYPIISAQYSKIIEVITNNLNKRNSEKRASKEKKETMEQKHTIQIFNTGHDIFAKEFSIDGNIPKVLRQMTNEELNIVLSIFNQAVGKYNISDITSLEYAVTSILNTRNQLLENHKRLVSKDLIMEESRFIQSKNYNRHFVTDGTTALRNLTTPFPNPLVDTMITEVKGVLANRSATPIITSIDYAAQCVAEVNNAKVERMDDIMRAAQERMSASVNEPLKENQEEQSSEYRLLEALKVYSDFIQSRIKNKSYKKQILNNLLSNVSELIKGSLNSYTLPVCYASGEVVELSIYRRKSSRGSCLFTIFNGMNETGYNHLYEVFESFNESMK